jgi:glycosyltransferase involved in cell wall biosynthesis
VSLTVLMNAGPWQPVPPEGYGGIENVVATLVPELRAAGVRVLLATVGPSRIEADGYIRTFDEPQLRNIAAPYNRVSGLPHAHMQAVVAALRADRSIDLVHDHLEVVGPATLAAMGTNAPPTLQTLHWDLTKHAAFYSTFDGGGRIGFAAVSQSQLDRAPAALRAQTLGVVPLAVPPPPPLDVATADHVLVLARITADKGQDIACRVCLHAGIPLVLAGPVAGIGDPGELHRRLDQGDWSLHNHPDVRFYLDRVAPFVDGERVSWVGSVDGLAKERLVRSARALFCPIRWEEPGGTGVVEALARGIPVVGTRRGVLPSLITHGVTGFLADDEPALAEALRRVAEISPEPCRDAAAAWSPEDMAHRYLDLYGKLLAGVGPVRPGTVVA